MNTETPIAPVQTDAPETPQDASLQKPDPKGLLLKLQEVSSTFRDYRPVVLRIDKSILERFPDFNRKALRTALRMHTSSTRYLKALERGTHRYDLDGAEGEEITQEHRDYAAQTLKERFAEVARKKREKQQQEAEREREEAAQQRREEKLNQLVGHFSRH